MAEKKKTNRFAKNHPAVPFDPTDLLRSGVIPAPVEENNETKLPEVPVVEEPVKTPAPAPVVEEPVRTPVVETPADPPVEEKPVEIAPAVPPAKQKAAPKKEETKDTIEDLFPDIVIEKPTGKPKTLYLDADVVDVLEKLAKKKKMSTSKVANALLRNALLGK